MLQRCWCSPRLEFSFYFDRVCVPLLRVSASCFSPLSTCSLRNRRAATAGSIEVQHEQGLLRVDGWARFKAPARIAGELLCLLFQHLRVEMRIAGLGVW